MMLKFEQKAQHVAVSAEHLHLFELEGQHIPGAHNDL
jgi:hypothetical protein